MKRFQKEIKRLQKEVEEHAEEDLVKEDHTEEKHVEEEPVEKDRVVEDVKDVLEKIIYYNLYYKYKLFKWLTTNPYY